MSEGRVQVMYEPAPRRTPRTYTPEEFAAARRLGLAEGKIHLARGSIFWTTDDHYLRMIQQKRNDYELLAKAIEREWEADDGE